MNILEHSGFDLDDTKLTYLPNEQFQKYLLSVIPLLLVDNERKICLW